MLFRSPDGRFALQLSDRNVHEILAHAEAAGDRETGGGLSLPIWINFMDVALKGVPVMEPSAPEGLVNVGGEWFYEEYARGNGVASLGLSAADAGADPSRPRPAGPSGEQPPGAPGDKSMNNSGGLPPPVAPAPADERRSILDLFRN